MRKLFGLLLMTVTLSGYAQAPAQGNEPKAEIKFESTVHDFGNIKEGTLAGYDFVFTNTGKVPLVLTDVRPTCGCTTPEWSREPIAPGAKGKIKAVYNSYGRPGAFQKYVVVKSNAATGELDLTIKGTVIVIPPDPVSPVRMKQNND